MKQTKLKKICFLSILFIGIIQLNAQVANETLGTLVAETEGTFTTGSSLTTGDYNVLIGDGAGSMLTSGLNNTFLGTSAGAQQTTASDNVFIGRFAGYFNIIGTDNVFIGTEAGRLNTGGDNTFIGTEAGENNTSGYDNVFIGEESGTNNTIGHDNVFIGEDAGRSNTIADDNTFVGSTAGLSNTIGEGNTFVGGESGTLTTTIDISFGGNGIYTLASLFGGVGSDNTTGNGNSFFGSGAGADNGVGMANTFLGYGAGSSNEHGDLNTFVGYGAGWDNNRTNSTTNANRNTYLGVIAGGTNREGSDNIGIGHDANFSVNTGAERNIFIGGSSRVRGTDNIVIGYNAKTRTNANRNNQIVIGVNSSTTENNAIVIGNNVTSTSANTLTLGGNTVTNRVSVGIGTLAANQNASLELADVDKGFLLNRVTTAERTAMETTPASGAALTTTDIGLMVYDTDLKSLFSWDGTMWSAANTNTDNQELDLTTDVLSISGGIATIDLSGYLDNTDAQNLTLSGSTLSIDNGTGVDLSSLQDGTGTDDQNLTSATLSGNTLTVAIEGGSSVNVDLAPILSALETENTNQQVQIDDLISRIDALEACACQTLNISEPNDNSNRAASPILYQNIPNPFNGTTSIKYYVPLSYKNAAIVFSNTSGQIIDNIALNQLGDQELFFNSDSLASGIYYYTLYANRRKIDTKKMIIN